MPDTFRIDLDTSLLRFDPNSPKFLKKLYKEIPAFAEYESENVQADATKHRLFAWIVILYDMNSPLRREVKDMYGRKVRAAELCGITPNALSGKYRDYVEKMMLGQDPDINELVVKFIASFSSPEYTQLMAHVSIQHNMLKKIVSGKEDRNVQQLFDNATDKVKELTNLLYGSGLRDEVYEARRALYKQVAYDLSDMRAESVAKAVATGAGLPSEWNPYGEDYVTDEIRFVGDDLEIARDDEEQLP
jgi:hypothetical protein